MANPSSSKAKIRAVAPKLYEMIEGTVYGDIWQRPALSPRDRSLPRSPRSECGRPTSCARTLKRASTMAWTPGRSANLRASRHLRRISRSDLGGAGREAAAGGTGPDRGHGRAMTWRTALSSAMSGSGHGGPMALNLRRRKNRRHRLRCPRGSGRAACRRREPAWRRVLPRSWRPATWCSPACPALARSRPCFWASAG